MTIKDHKFTPEELKVPADQRVVITVINDDVTPEEFESNVLKVEKVIPGKSKGTVRVGPLKPGRYPFIGEFHEGDRQRRLDRGINHARRTDHRFFVKSSKPALIVGIVMAATRGVAGRGRWINIGIGGGVPGRLHRRAVRRRRSRSCSKAPGRNCSMPAYSASP
ncbi:MAG: cupredoxin domain-containing protein [Pseudolabrys sp.]